jgi:hypothetical protein
MAILMIRTAIVRDLAIGVRYMMVCVGVGRRGWMWREVDGMMRDSGIEEAEVREVEVPFLAMATRVNGCVCSWAMRYPDCGDGVHFADRRTPRVLAIF